MERRSFMAASRRVCLILLATVLLATVGCATRSKVSASNEIATAQFAVRDARASGAETYSLEELRKAEVLIEQAQQASGAQAERLAEQAIVHAQLAGARAARDSARKKLMEAQSMESEAGALKRRTTRAVEEQMQ